MNPELAIAVKEGSNFHTLLRDGRKVVCFRYQDWQIVTDYSTDHEGYEAIVAQSDDIKYSIMGDLYQTTFHQAVKWLSAQLDPQLDLF